MSYDLFRGHSPKNFAIQGHPPLHSHEYVMAGGGYYAPPARPWRPRTTNRTTTEATSPSPQPTYEVSSNDWIASSRWISNLAENIKAVRRELGDKILTVDEVGKFADLWRRWLLLGNKVGSGLSPMLPELRREWAGLMGEGWQLYERYRLLGLNRVAPPYLGEIAVVLATSPAEDSLVNMSSRLLDAARAGERLLDPKTPWWSWRRPADPRPLAEAVNAARLLARKIIEVARTSPGEGLRDRGSPIYTKVLAVLTGLYAAASALYGGEEKPGRAGEEAESRAEAPRTSLFSVGWLVLVGGIGYLGTKWLIGGKKEDVAGNNNPGYHPGVSQRVANHNDADAEEYEDKQPEEG